MPPSMGYSLRHSGHPTIPRITLRSIISDGISTQWVSGWSLGHRRNSASSMNTPHPYPLSPSGKGDPGERADTWISSTLTWAGWASAKSTAAVSSFWRGIALRWGTPAAALVSTVSHDGVAGGAGWDARGVQPLLGVF